VSGKETCKLECPRFVYEATRRVLRNDEAMLSEVVTWQHFCVSPQSSPMDEHNGGAHI